MFPGLNPWALAVQAPACAGEERTHLAKPAHHVSFFLVDLSGAGDAERAGGDVLACEALRTIIDPLLLTRFKAVETGKRQSPTLQQTLSVFEAENTGGRLANIGQRYDGDAIRIIQTKMVAPGVQARVV